jgi:drug/metabolite transporter (DMT)-like permease
MSGWLAAFGVVLIWSGWVVVSRLGVVQTLTIYDMVALRFLVDAIAVSPFVVSCWPRNLCWWKVVLLGCGPGAPYLLFAFTGMKFAPASHAGILMNGSLPILAALIGWLWLGDRSSNRTVIGLTIILSGCVMIGLDRRSGGATPDAWIGHLFFLSAACILAAYMVATKFWQLAPLQAMVAIPTVNLVWFGPVYLAFLPSAIDQAPWSEILLQGIYQGLAPSILGVLFFTMAIRSIGPTPTAAVMAGVPGLAALLAIPVLGEWPSMLAWIGLAVVTTGILLTTRRQPPRTLDQDKVSVSHHARKS